MGVMFKRTGHDGSTVGCADYLQRSADHFGAVLHDVNTAPSFARNISRYASAVVSDAQRSQALSCVKSQRNFRWLSMFDRVVHCFLRDVVKMGRYMMVGDPKWTWAIKLTGNPVHFLNHVHQASQGIHESIGFKRDRTQTFDQGARVVDRCVDEFHNFASAGGFRLALRLQLALKNTGEERDAGQFLPKTIMQVPSDAFALLRADIKYLALQSLALADVAENASKDAAIAQLHFTDRQVNGKSGAVLSKADYLTSDADDPGNTRGLVAVQVFIVFFSVRLGHDHDDVATDSFFLGITKQSLSGGIEALHGASFVDGDDRIDGCIKDGLQLLFAITEGLRIAALLRLTSAATKRCQKLIHAIAQFSGHGVAQLVPMLSDHAERLQR